MPYSSGTTGLPKGVLLSHHNIVANISQIQSPSFDVLSKATDTFQEVIPVVLPMTHIYGFTVICLSGLCAGAKMVTLPKFSPEWYVNTLKNYNTTILFTVPPIVIFLNTHPMVKKEYLQSTRTVVCGAAPLGALDEIKLKDKVAKPIDVLQGFGLSEASPVVSFTPLADQKTGSTGKVLPNTTVKIVPLDDPNGEPLGRNQVGELVVKGPQVMKGYHNRDEETAATLVDGWLRTGDVVYYDESEHIFVTDRIKELIKVNAFQVPPAELEEIIRDVPNVSDAAVIGIPHPKYGEVPRAYVVPKPNTKVEASTVEEIINSKVAEYKKLRGGVVVTDSIPKNASGKIMRRILKMQYLEANK